MRILSLCTHYSARPQMAEGLLRARGGGRFDVFSAGTHPRVTHSLAIVAMREAGIDIGEQRATGIGTFANQPPVDLVVTVCDEAAREGPAFSGALRQEHWSFSDPSAVIGAEEERLAAFRRVRDAVAARLEEVISTLPEPHDSL